MIKNSSKLIGPSESTTIEWKPSLSQINEIIESIVAFSNTEGGKLFVGVSKHGEFIGVSIGKGTIENLANKIAQHTEPKIQPRITVKKIEGKEIIIIEVKPSGDKLILADGRPYKRVGPSTRRMGKDEYEERIFEKYKDKLQFDEMICRGSTFKDIDSQKVRWFLDEAEKQKRFTVPKKIIVKDALIRLNLLRRDKLT